METLSACPACGGAGLRPWDPAARLQACDDCSLVFDNPRLDAQGIEGFYTRFGQYDHWLDDLPGRERVWKRRLAAILRHARHGRVFDIGAGIGQFLDNARRAGFEVDGLELSPRGCQHARERFGIELRQGRLEDFRLPAAHYDVVTIFHVLEHVPDPAWTLAECARILVDGGVLVVAVPNEIEAVTSRLHRLLRRIGLPGLGSRGRNGVKSLATAPHLDEVHLSRFTAATLRGLLERSGYEVLDLGVDRHLPETGLKGLAWKIFNFFADALARTTGIFLHPAMLVCARKRRLKPE